MSYLHQLKREQVWAWFSSFSAGGQRQGTVPDVISQPGLFDIVLFTGSENEIDRIIAMQAGRQQLYPGSGDARTAGPSRKRLLVRYWKVNQHNTAIQHSLSFDWFTQFWPPSPGQIRYCIHPDGRPVADYSFNRLVYLVSTLSRYKAI